MTVQERREQNSKWSWNYATERRTVEGTRVSVTLKRYQTGSKHGSPLGQFCPLGHICRFLETFLVVTVGWVPLAPSVHRPGAF